MIKAVALVFLAAILIGISCYDWSRMSEPGVLTQETCNDIPVGDPRRAGCQNPEDFRDDSVAVIDPVTGDTVRFNQTSRRMFLGRPNGAGWLFALAALVPLFFAVKIGRRELAERKGQDKKQGLNDWTCPRCKAAVPVDQTNCWQCGWERAKGDRQ